jgi:hypothetical protein
METLPTMLQLPVGKRSGKPDVWLAEKRATFGWRKKPCAVGSVEKQNLFILSYLSRLKISRFLKEGAAVVESSMPSSKL